MNAPPLRRGRAAGAGALRGGSGPGLGRGRLRPGPVLLVELLVLVVRADLLAADDQVLDLRPDLERISVGDDEVGDLSHFYAAETVAVAEDIGRVERDGAECHGP